MEKNRQLMTAKNLAYLSICLMIGLSGCGINDNAPRPLNPEVDTCAVCHMSIVDEEYAAQTVFANGDYEVFDDLGCMVQYAVQQQTANVGANYVKDAKTDEWLDANKATYVYHPDFWTPMSYGVLAFATSQQAEAYIESKGKGTMMKQEDLQQHKWGVHTDE
jgi:copper chaperone NosL